MPEDATAPVHVEAATAPAMIDLRARLPQGDAGDACLSALEAACGVSLPLQPRRATASETREALWMSPDQWLLLCPHEDAAALLEALEQARQETGVNLMATDMSSARALIRLHGDGAREVLMKAIAVDFLPPAFMPGDVRRCSFAGVAAMVHCRAAAPDAFDLYVFASYAAFALAWLQRAAMPAARVTLFRDPGRPSPRLL